MPQTFHLYEVGQRVYHLLGEEPGVVIGVSKYGEPVAPVLYSVVWAESRVTTEHYEIELVDTPLYREATDEIGQDEGQ